MNQAVQGIFINKNDLCFIKYLHAVKAATYIQIHRDNYPNHSLESACNRVRKMEDNKLIDGERNRTCLDGKRAIHLTQKAFDIFLKNGEEQRIELKSNSVEHDVTLVDIRYRLMKCPKIKGYLTENEIETWGHTIYDRTYSPLVKLRADAILSVQFSIVNLYIPLEYDAHDKSASRYETILKKYYRSDEAQIIFFILNSKSAMNKIMKIESQIYKTSQPKFFYALKNNLLRDDEVKFFNYKKDILNLK